MPFARSPRNSLSAYRSYAFTLEAWLTFVRDEKTRIPVRVDVAAQPVQASIAGGNRVVGFNKVNGETRPFAAPPFLAGLRFHTDALRQCWTAPSRSTQAAFLATRTTSGSASCPCTRRARWTPRAFPKAVSLPPPPARRLRGF